MPEENRVFDVAKPGQVGANPTSKPVIVGHQPTMADPMVKDEARPTHIMIQDSSTDSEEHTSNSGSDSTNGPGLFTEPESQGSTLSHQNQPTLSPSQEVTPDEPAVQAQPDSSVFPTSEPAAPADTLPASEPVPTAPTDAGPLTADSPHVEELHVSPPQRRSPIMKIVLAILILLVAAYLLIDAGVVKAGINLPFHIFKQNTATPAATSSNTNTNQSQTNTPAVPAGFTEYKLAGTTLTFAAPTAWGTPTSTNDPGYSARSNNAKSDGTYAYLVDFATNKDVEVAVTSSQYLPTKRAAQYYDFLQWCTGTNDGKFYETVMNFTTTSGVDKPSTATCNQGPVDAIKLDNTTIVQTKAKTTDGKVIGDIYTKNLTDTNLPVIRLKDATSTNSDNIKQLLSTVKISS